MELNGESSFTHAQRRFDARGVGAMDGGEVEEQVR